MENHKRPRVTASPARQDTDEVLLMDLAQGNLAALDTLYMRYARPVFSLAMRVVGNTADAEEVTQDVFEQVWRHAARFDPARGQAGTWLMSITAHVALDARRKQQRRPTTRRDTHGDEYSPHSGRCPGCVCQHHTEYGCAPDPARPLLASPTTAACHRADVLWRLESVGNRGCAQCAAWHHQSAAATWHGSLAGNRRRVRPPTRGGGRSCAVMSTGECLAARWRSGYARLTHAPVGTSPQPLGHLPSRCAVSPASLEHSMCIWLSVQSWT